MSESMYFSIDSVLNFAKLTKLQLEPVFELGYIQLWLHYVRSDRVLPITSSHTTYFLFFVFFSILPQAFSTNTVTFKAVESTDEHPVLFRPLEHCFIPPPLHAP